MVDMELAKEMLKEEDCLSFAMKRCCTWQTNGLEKKEQRKMTYGTGKHEAKIDFVLVGKNNRNCLEHGKAILWEL